MSVKKTSKNEHHGRHPERTTNKRVLSADLVNSNDQEDTRCSNLDSAVNTGSKQGSIGLGNTNRLENLRSIVAYSELAWKMIGVFGENAEDWEQYLKPISGLPRKLHAPEISPGRVPIPHENKLTYQCCSSRRIVDRGR
jgi:hypothetical protein